MVTQLVDVDHIRFTQEHVYDSFNANDDRAMNVVDLIDCILKGQKTPLDLPLIRVAVKKGAYWCVDNRRLFVYKHCQLGAIPVQVCTWKDNREFELKWKNGRSVRAQTGGGRRVGVLQRTDRPFPRSAVAEPSLSKIRHFLAPDEQQRHDAAIAALRARRSQAAAEPQQLEEKQALLEVLRPLSKSSSATSSAKRKRQACVAPAAGEAAPLAARAAAEAAVPKVKRRKKKRSAAVAAEVQPEPLAKASAATGAGGTTLKVTLDCEDSGDEDYLVEVFAPS